jgi:hypothetical protein
VRWGWEAYHRWVMFLEIGLVLAALLFFALMDRYAAACEKI